MKKIIRILLFALLILSLVFYRDTLRDILEGIRQVTWGELGISIFLSFLGYLLEGLTIFLMMGAVIPRSRIGASGKAPYPVREQAKAREGIFIAFVCEFYRLTTLGNGSGIAEIHFLHKKKVEPGSAAILTMIQYMVKRAAIMFFGMGGFLYLFHRGDTRRLCERYAVFMGAGCLITLAVIAFFLCIALWPKAADGALWAIGFLCGKIPSQKKNLEKGKEQILLLGKSGKSILRQKKRMLGVFCLQVGKLTAFYLIPAIALKGKTGLAVMESVLVMAVAYMLSGVIPAPSGAGALEFVFLLFFTCFAESAVAVPAILLFRFATWVFPAACGGALLLVQEIFRKKGKNI